MGVDRARKELLAAQRKVDEAQARLDRHVRSRDEAQLTLEEAEAQEDVISAVGAQDLKGAGEALARLKETTNKKKRER